MLLKIWMSVLGKRSILHFLICLFSSEIMALVPFSHIYICYIVVFHLTLILPEHFPSIFKAHKLVQEFVLIVVIHIDIVNSNIGVIF